jgi:hypothetical protein
MRRAYREEDQRRGRELVVGLIASIRHGGPKALSQVIT